MIIPKKYGGLEFSAYAHSQVLIKIASVSATAVSTVAVPNQRPIYRKLARRRLFRIIWPLRTGSDKTW